MPPTEKDPLPTDRQRQMICEMIYTAFVEMRALARGSECERAHDLAYAFHNIPKEMYGWGRFSWAAFRRALDYYQTKWIDGLPGADYVAMLDKIQAEP